MGKLLNMGIAMQVQNPPVTINYTPSPNGRAVEVTLSRSVSFDKSFTVNWTSVNTSGSVTVTVLANTTSIVSANQILTGDSFTLIQILAPSANPGYNWNYTGDWTV